MYRLVPGVALAGLTGAMLLLTAPFANATQPTEVTITTEGRPLSGPDLVATRPGNPKGVLISYRQKPSGFNPLQVTPTLLVYQSGDVVLHHWPGRGPSRGKISQSELDSLLRDVVRTYRFLALDSQKIRKEAALHAMKADAGTAVVELTTGKRSHRVSAYGLSTAGGCDRARYPQSCRLKEVIKRLVALRTLLARPPVSPAPPKPAPPDSGDFAVPLPTNPNAVIISMWSRSSAHRGPILDGGARFVVLRDGTVELRSWRRFPSFTMSQQELASLIRELVETHGFLQLTSDAIEKERAGLPRVPERSTTFVALATAQGVHAVSAYDLTAVRCPQQPKACRLLRVVERLDNLRFF